MKKILLLAILFISPGAGADGHISLDSSPEAYYAHLLRQQAAKLGPQPVDSKSPFRISEKQFKLLLNQLNVLEYKIDYVHEQLTQLESKHSIERGAPAENQ